VRIVSDQGRFMHRGTLSDLERRWNAHGFHRVHRAYLVNLRRAVEMRPDLGGTGVLLLSDGSEIPVARRQVSELLHRLRM
jgi:DNA-binding LytR/AlgR family response regulator